MIHTRPNQQKKKVQRQATQNELDKKGSKAENTKKIKISFNDTRNSKDRGKNGRQLFRPCFGSSTATEEGRKCFF